MMAKTTSYFSEFGNLIKMSPVWVRKSNQLFWIQNAPSNYCTHLSAKGREGTALHLPGEEGQPVIFVSPLLLSCCLGHGWNKNPTGGGTGCTAYIPTRIGILSRKNQWQSLKQLREVPPRVGTGGDWPTALARAAASKNILQAPREEWASSATHR